MNWRDGTKELLIPITSKARIGLLTDMDGTISPIVEYADLAQVSDVSRQYLAELQKIITLVAVISGRAVSDLVQKVNLPHIIYVGNHGLERWEHDAVQIAHDVSRYRPKLDIVIRRVTPQLQEGMWIEDKGTTLTVHYRQSPNPEVVAEQIAPFVNKIVAEQGLRFSHGKMAFEIKPDLKIDKGTTIRRLVSEYSLDAAVYLGDDTSDIDALLVARTMRDKGECFAVGIGVESEEMPSQLRESADLLANGVTDVEAFLEWFLSVLSHRFRV